MGVDVWGVARAIGHVIIECEQPCPRCITSPVLRWGRVRLAGANMCPRTRLSDLPNVLSSMAIGLRRPWSPGVGAISVCKVVVMSEPHHR